VTQGLLFDGPDLEPEDEVRLTGQLQRVRMVMADGRWRTLAEIAELSSVPTRKVSSEAGISARLRDFRKARFGGHVVERRRRSQGLWEYRILWRVKP